MDYFFLLNHYQIKVEEDERKHEINSPRQGEKRPKAHA